MLGSRCTNHVLGGSLSPHITTTVGVWYCRSLGKPMKEIVVIVFKCKYNTIAVKGSAQQAERGSAVNGAHYSCEEWTQVWFSGGTWLLTTVSDAACRGSQHSLWPARAQAWTWHTDTHGGKHIH